MNAFMRATILTLSSLLLTTVIFGADSNSNRKENIVSFGVRAGAGWPAVTTPFFLAVPGKNWSFGLEYGVLDWIMEVKHSRQMERCLNHLLQA